MSHDVTYPKEDPNEDASANTYAGKRNDLLLDDDEGYLDRDEIKNLVRPIAQHELGITAFILAQVAGCSKEWARQILNNMHKEGKLTCRQMGQLKLFGLPDVPCPHCGEMMSAYILNGACTRCSSFGGGR